MEGQRSRIQASSYLDWLVPIVYLHGSGLSAIIEHRMLHQLLHKTHLHWTQDTLEETAALQIAAGISHDVLDTFAQPQKHAVACPPMGKALYQCMGMLPTGSLVMMSGLDA